MMRLDAAVIARWNNCFVILIALLRSVSLSDLTAG